MKILLVLLIIINLQVFSAKDRFRDSIRMTVKNNHKKLSECALLLSEKEQVKVVLSWDINKEGKATNIKVVKSASKNLDECVSNFIASLDFPKPENYSIYQISSYPFTFKNK